MGKKNAKFWYNLIIDENINIKTRSARIVSDDSNYSYVKTNKDMLWLDETAAFITDGIKFDDPYVLYSIY